MNWLSLFAAMILAGLLLLAVGYAFKQARRPAPPARYCAQRLAVAVPLPGGGYHIDHSEPHAARIWPRTVAA